MCGELRETAYNAAIIDDALVDDSLADGGRAGKLERRLAGRGPRPRIVRLASIVRLAHRETAGEQWFDADLAKPVRLADLHDSLIGGGCASGLLFGAGAHVPRGAAGVESPLQGRVLVVEDQPVNREVAGGMLRALGLEVESAADGREALEMLAAGRYDLVLMDCQMPVMDGWPATAELRKREAAGEHVPVIALTADTTTPARKACLAAGMDDYLGKPFTRVTLHAALYALAPCAGPG